MKYQLHKYYKYCMVIWNN